jgi:hypothetical protein
MLKGLRYFFGGVLSALGSRKDLVLENLALTKDTPMGRAVATAFAGNVIQSCSRLGGLHHRYVAAA